MRSAETKAVGLQRSPDVFLGRVVVCKAAPGPVLDQVMNLLHDRQQLEPVETLAEGMQRCLEGGVDRLIVNMFGFTTCDLTALLIFHEIMPNQQIVIFCLQDTAKMILLMGIAIQIHLVTVA